MPVIRQLKEHRILLDTHVWIWVMSGEGTLVMSFRRALDHLLKIHNVMVSPISIWEIGMLVEKQRIQLDMDTQEWVDEALDLPGIKLTPITPRIAIQSTRLPGLAHGDPADRLLIATAHNENAVLVTCDKTILKYGKDKFVNVYDPSA